MKFENIVDNLDKTLNMLFENLIESDSIDISKAPNINAVYALYENNIPIYIGRSNKKRLGKRLKEHYLKSSNKNSATFAYILATEKAKETIGSDLTMLFDEAKIRISNMKVRFVEIDDSIIQTVFEPFLAFKLKTFLKYNKFDTH